MSFLVRHAQQICQGMVDQMQSKEVWQPVASEPLSAGL